MIGQTTARLSEGTPRDGAGEVVDVREETDEEDDADST